MITIEILSIIVIIVVVFVLFATEKFPVDLVALISIVVLLVFGLVTAEEAVSGFSNPATITIIAMFMLSEGIRRTGIIYEIGEKILHYTKTLTQQLLAISLISTLGAFINNTASVVILAPMVINIAKKTKSFATQLLIPVSFLSMAAGTITLIGTSTNLLVNDVYIRAGFPSIGLFDIAPLGIIVFLMVTVYFLTIGRFLLPKRPGHTDITDPYLKMSYNADAILPPESELIGQKIKDCVLNQYDIKITSLRRKGKVYRKNIKKFTIHDDDEIVLYGSRLKLLQAEGKHIVQLASSKIILDKNKEYLLEQFMIAEGSSLINQTTASIRFMQRFSASLIALKRGNRVLKESIHSVKLKFSDIILIEAQKEVVDLMKMSDDFVYIGEITGPYRTGKMKEAIVILLFVVFLATVEILPIMTSAIFGVVLMVLFKVINLYEGYKAINWQVIFLLAGVIPLGIALQNTGAIDLISQLIVGSASQLSPVMVLGLFYLVTTVMTQIISNNATAIILAPIGISIAIQLGLNPFVFMVVIMFAASTSFITPIGYQTNALVYTLGNYRFTDFVKVGLPINVILMFVTTFLAAWIWGL